MRLAILTICIGVTLTAHPRVASTVNITARALQPGEVVVVTIGGIVTTDTVRVRAFGRMTSAFPSAGADAQALVGIDLDVKPGSHSIVTEITRAGDAPTTITTPIRVTAKSFPTRRLTVDPSFVEPPPEVQARITREAAELAALWEGSLPRRLWNGPFVAPVPDAANSAFGSRSIFNGQARSPHGGADFSSPTGRPVVSPNAGRIVLARDLYYTGQTVVIDHGLGLLSLFAHLSAFEVVEGRDVKTGDAIGRVGATGRVTGPHLHWTVRLGGARVDPLALLAVVK